MTALTLKADLDGTNSEVVIEPDITHGKTYGMAITVLTDNSAQTMFLDTQETRLLIRALSGLPS